MMRLAALALALLSGCSYEVADRNVFEGGVRVSLDPAMGADDAASVVQAADNWAAVAPCVPFTVAMGDADAGVVHVRAVPFERLAAGRCGRAEPGAALAGCTSEGFVEILSGAPALAHVSAHELGHAMGLGHSDDPASVMYPVASLDTPPTPADGETLCALVR